MSIRCAALAASALLAMPAGAVLISYENFNYSGTVTAYDSEADYDADLSSGTYGLPTNTNGANSTLPNARDATVYFDDQDQYFAFLTAWYFTPQEHLGSPDGTGNPNNSNVGFIQLFDAGLTSVTSATVDYSGTTMILSLDVTGAALTPNSRLWEAPTNAAGSGTWLDYDLSMQFFFGDGIGAQPTDVTGTFDGTFLANSGGVYVADFELAYGSMAEADNWAYQPFGDTYAESAQNVFVSVPAPAALGLLGLGVLGLGAVRRRQAA